MNVAEISLMGIHLINSTMTQAIGLIQNCFENDLRGRVFYMNADCFNKVPSDQKYREVLDRAEFVFPDGVGVELVSRVLGSPLTDNRNGTDMFPEICKLSVKKNYKLFFLGASQGVAEELANNVQKKYPEIKIAGTHHGYFAADEEAAIINKINSSGADLVFVAMGAPRQEKWIDRNFERLEARVVLAVGGLFDFFSERIRRAPAWVRRIRFEWVYRLIQEPQRLRKRYLLGNPLYLLRSFRWHFNSYLGIETA